MRRTLSLALLTPCLAAFAAPTRAQAPALHEGGWTLVRACSTGVFPTQGMHHDPSTGATLFASDGGGFEGLHRVGAACAQALVTALPHANGVLVDPKDNDIFVSDLWGGVIYRVAAGTSVASTWVSGFHSGDDDPFGMAIAPPDYSGPVLGPGEALVVDAGVNGSPKEIWKWSPDVAQNEVRVHVGAGALGEPTDVTITRSAIYFVDWAAGTSPGEVWRLDAVDSASLVATQGFLPPVGGITVDPLDDSLLLRSPTQVLRLNPSTGVFRAILTLPGAATGARAGIDLTADGRTLVVTDAATGTLYVFERAVITSSDEAFALASSASTVDAQSAAFNATPPSFDPATWQSVWRHADQHLLSSYICGQLGVNPVTESYLTTTSWLHGVDEVTYDNCSSAWYRFTFSLPPSFKSPRLAGLANVDDQGVVFLNGQRMSGALNFAGCQPTAPSDPCYALFDTGDDFVDASGKALLTAPTPDRFATASAAWFRPGVNELVFAVCGDASPYEPTGLEFAAAVHWDRAVSSYCTAKIDSLGCVPAISAVGQPSLSLSTPFEVRVSAVQSQRSGILFYGYAPHAAPWKGGWLCVQPVIRRTAAQSSGGAGGGASCTGTLSVDFTALSLSGVDPLLVAGANVFVQGWYRDPWGSAGAGLSAGLSFTLEP